MSTTWNGIRGYFWQNHYLKYYENRGKEELREVVEQISSKIGEIEGITTIPNLMQLEGEVRKVYYGSFSL